MAGNAYQQVRDALNRAYPQYYAEGEYNGKGWSFVVIYSGEKPSEAEETDITNIIQGIAAGASVYMLPQKD